MKVKTRIGIVGAGKIVENAHLPALLGRNDITVEWVADKLDAHSERVAKMFSVKCIPISQACKRIDGIDLCLLAIPYGVRNEYLSACAANHVAVYVEKPLAKTVDEHERLIKSIGTNRLAVGFQRRYYNSVAILRDLIRSRVFGTLKSASVHLQNYSLTSGGGRYITDASISGGGITIEVGIHLLDVVVDLLRPSRIETIRVDGLMENGIDYHIDSSHILTTEGHRIPVECHFSLLCQGASGILFNFESAQLEIGMEAQGAIRVHSLQHDHVFGLESNLAPSTYRANSSAEAFACAWDDFLRVVRQEGDCRLLASHSVKTTDWIESIYAGLNNA